MGRPNPHLVSDQRQFTLALDKLPIGGRQHLPKRRNHISLKEVMFKIAPGTRYEVSAQSQGHPITCRGRQLIVQKEEGKKNESSLYRLENSAATKSLSELSFFLISFT